MLTRHEWNGFTPKKKENSKTRHNARHTKNVKCFGYNKKGHLASVCPNKMDDKTKSSKMRQASNKQDKKTKDGRKYQTCYNCWEKDILVRIVPKVSLLSLLFIMIIIFLRKDENGRVIARCVSSPKIIAWAIWVLKFIVINIYGPNHGRRQGGAQGARAPPKINGKFLKLGISDISTQ